MKQTRRKVHRERSSWIKYEGLVTQQGKTRHPIRQKGMASVVHAIPLLIKKMIPLKVPKLVLK